MEITILKCPHQILIEERGNFKDSIGSNQTYVGVGITAFKISTDRGNYERAKQMSGVSNYSRSV